MLKVFFFALIPLILLIGIIPIDAFAENNFPKWVEIYESWLAEGEISEQEYKTALQYLENISSIKNSESKFDITVNENNNKKYLDSFEKRNTAPTESEIANYYLVTISDGPHKKQISSYTFHEIDFNYDKQLPNGLETPDFSLQVALKSLPGKDNQEIYDIISQLDNVILSTRHPVDMRVDTFSGDNFLIHSVFLNKCQFVDYNIFVQNAFDFESEYLFPKAEDEIVLNCAGFSFKAGLDTVNELKINTSKPFEVKRQKSDLVGKFDIQFQHKDTTKSANSFTRFISNHNDEKTTFALESMTGSDKSWYYKTLGVYSKFNHLPGKIDVSIDIKSDGNQIMQTWNYKKCKPIETKIVLEENKDIVDKTVFECAGRDITSGESFVKREFDYTNEPLSGDEIVKTFRVNFYGGNLPQKITYENLLKFGTFQYTPANTATKVPGFWIESLSSKKTHSMYKDLEYYFSSSAKKAPVFVEVELVTEKGMLRYVPLFTSCKIILVDPQMEIVNGERRLVDRVAFGCNNFVLYHLDEN